MEEQPLTNDEIAQLKQAVRSEIGTEANPVILTTLGVRREFRELIESEFPQVAVLAYQELSPDLNIQPVARISCEFVPSVSQAVH